MADEPMEPFVLDFPNGQRVEDILKKAQNMVNIQTIGEGLSFDAGTGELSAPGGGGTGTDDYNLLNNKPKVNHVELTGDKSLVDLGILFATSLIAEIDSSTYVVTLTLEDQEGNVLGEPQSLDLPLESVVVGGRYDNTTKKVILTLQNGNTVEFSVADLVDGLQSELSSTNKLNPEFINYNSTHRAVSDTEKSTWNGKQDALTFDNTPTNGSSNPVKSGGVYAALEDKVDKVDGKGLSTNDFTNEYKSQIAKNTEGIGTLANRGSKNIVDIQKPTTVTRCSYTILANGGVELNCADAQWTSYAIADISMEIGKPYVIKFMLDESSGTNDFYFFLRENNSSGTNLATKNYGNTTGEYIAEFTPTTDIAWLGIYLNNSATARTATAKVRCMITPKSIYDADATYQPYAKTNAELTVSVESNKAGIGAVANRGSKNLYDIDSMDTAGTYNATHTLTDGVLTVTSSGSYGRLTNRISMKPGTYIFSCDISNVSIAGGTAEIRIAKSASGSDALVRKSFSQAGILSAVFEVTEATDIFLMYYLNLSSTSYTNSADFTKVMIRPAAIEDSTYQPYAPTNRELYATKIDVGLTAIPSGTTLESFANLLSLGTHICFYNSANNASDAPVGVHAIVEVHKYSNSTGDMTFNPLSTTYQTNGYRRILSSGTWRDWIVFTGTPVST